jgi:hypothetical protein
MMQVATLQNVEMYHQIQNIKEFEHWKRVVDTINIDDNFEDEVELGQSFCQLKY